MTQLPFERCLHLEVGKLQTTFSEISYIATDLDIEFLEGGALLFLNDNEAVVTTEVPP